MTYRNAVTDHFSSFFLAHQVVPQTVRSGGVARGRSAMIVNLSAAYGQRFPSLRTAPHRANDPARRNKHWAADTCYDVHPLALWILCAAFEHSQGAAKPDKALSYYHENNACASFGSYGTGTPLSRAFYAARRCMYDTRSGCGAFRGADPMVNALAELNGWVPTEAELIALRRGGWSHGFDFARFCPDLPAHDGWSGKGGGML